MGALGFLLVIAAIVVAFIVPLIAFGKATRAEQENERLADRLRHLEQQLRNVQERLATAITNRAFATGSDEPAPRSETGSIQSETGVAKLLAASEAARTAAAAQEVPPVDGPPVVSPTSPIPPPLPPGQEPSGEMATARTSVSVEPQTDMPEKEVPAFAKTSRPAMKSKFSLENFNWEQFMGVRLFAWLGGLALFLAAAFFLKYSFERGLIPPVLRVTLGFATGIGLLIGGVRMSQKRYKITADTLSATGVVILYAVTFACRVVYHFAPFGVTTTFLLMALNTAVAFVIAARLNALVVAVLGMLGGFLTPILLSTGQDNPFGLFSYIALLDIGLLAVAYVRRWDWLNLAGAIGTVAMQFGWVASFFNADKVFVALAVFLIFCALYLGSAFWSHRRGRSNHWLITGTLLIPAATFVFVLVLIANEVTGHRPGVLFSFILGADLAVLGLAALHARAVTGDAGTPGSATPMSVIPSSPLVAIPSLSWLNAFAGGIVFFLLSIWTGTRVDDSLLFWALGGSMILAILHTAFPIALRRLHPDESIPVGTQLFPIVSLLVVLIPIIRFESVSFLLWPFVLMIDLLAIGVAVLVASITGIVLALLVTAGVALVWLARIPAEITGLPEMLVVIVVMAGLFTVAGVSAGQKILALQKGGKTNASSGWLPAGWTSADVQQQIPALSAIMPCLLLLVVTGRVPLANPAPVFGTGLVLAGLMLGLTRLFKLNWLPAISLGCTCLVEFAWHTRNFPETNAGLAVAWYAIFFAVFTIYPFIFHRGDDSRLVAWISSALSGPLISGSFTTSRNGRGPTITWD